MKISLGFEAHADGAVPGIEHPSIARVIDAGGGRAVILAYPVQGIAGGQGQRVLLAIHQTVQFPDAGQPLVTKSGFPAIIEIFDELERRGPGQRIPGQFGGIEPGSLGEPIKNEFALGLKAPFGRWGWVPGSGNRSDHV